MTTTGNQKNPLERLAATWSRGTVGFKAISFALVGAVNTVIDLGVFLVAYQVFGLSLVASNILAWLVAVSASYVMNSFTTFAAESGRQLRLRDYGSFVLSGVAGVIANTITLVVASYFVPVLLAKLLAIGVSFVVNFSLSHWVVFRARSEPNSSDRS
jgi:putative flippase GtrA